MFVATMPEDKASFIQSQQKSLKIKCLIQIAFMTNGHKSSS